MIAVTGANGLLGSFVVRKLLEQNRGVIAIKRAGSDTSLLQDCEGRIQWRNADINDPVAVREALHGATGVIHTAAIVSFNPRNKKKIFRVNVEGTRTLVDASLELGLSRFAHVSSVAALGRQKNQTTLAEDNKWVDSSLNSVYGESKYYAELEVFRAQEEGLSTVMVNPSVILAPANWNNSSAKLFKYVWDEKPFYINGSLNYVDVRDVASLLIQLYDAPVQGERFIVSAGNMPFKTFFDKIAGQFNKKPPHVKLGKTFLQVMARLENFRTLFTSAEPLITTDTARLADTFFLYDNQKVRKALGYEFQTIDSTLEWCCSHYRELHAVKIK